MKSLEILVSERLKRKNKKEPTPNARVNKKEPTPNCQEKGGNKK